MSDAAPGAPELLDRALSGPQVPRHVAIIMDGNGRWAAERGLPRWMGHREGMKSVRRSVVAALDLGLSHLTLYAFSKENWSRPPEEVSSLMRLLCEYVERERADLADKGVRVRVLGDIGALTEEAQKAVESIETTTARADRLQLNLCISYGARDEILRAARRLADSCVRGDMKPMDISAESFSAELYTADSPDPDLLIRTSGEMRISNFLLWQIAYSEIHVTPVLWPDFEEADLYGAVLDYQGRERRFGGVNR